MMHPPAALIVADLPWLATPLRLARLRDAPPQLDGDPWLAAAVALAHRAPRVVLATPTQLARPDLTATILLSLVAPTSESPAWCADRQRFPTVLWALPPTATPSEVIAFVAQGVLPVLGTGSFLAPGRMRPDRVSAAMLAVPLELRAVSRLLPTVTVDAPPHAPELVAAGALTFADFPRPPTPRAHDDSTHAADTTLPSQLVAHLETLVRDAAYRLPTPPTLRREADRILRDAVARRQIASYVLAVTLVDGIPTLDVYVKLPRVVQEVALRLTQVAHDRGK